MTTYCTDELWTELKRTLALDSLAFVLARLQSGDVLLFEEESVSESVFVLQ